jgi:hypothetical protein
VTTARIVMPAGLSFPGPDCPTPVPQSSNWLGPKAWPKSLAQELGPKSSAPRDISDDARKFPALWSPGSPFRNAA